MVTPRRLPEPAPGSSLHLNMKGKLTVLDLRAEVANLSRRVVGMRVSNVYDYNAKTYMLKLARTDEKIFVLLESGVRSVAPDRYAPRTVYALVQASHYRVCARQILHAVGLHHEAAQTHSDAARRVCPARRRFVLERSLAANGFG